VTALEAAGHEVVWARIAAPGMTDSDMLAWAAREERILLTFDKKRFRRTGQRIGAAADVRCHLAADADAAAERCRTRLADLITARTIGPGTSPPSSQAESECDRSDDVPRWRCNCR
jgi:hypothetical protein